MTEGKAVVDYLKKALFIYTANVCRSSMPEAMFNAFAEDETSVSGPRAQE